MYLMEIPESYKTGYLARWILTLINQFNITYSFWKQITWMQQVYNHDFISRK